MLKGININVKVIVILTVLVLVFLFVWPGVIRYSYYTVNNPRNSLGLYSGGQRLVRVDRLTGVVQHVH